MTCGQLDPRAPKHVTRDGVSELAEGPRADWLSCCVVACFAKSVF